MFFHIVTSSFENDHTLFYRLFYLLRKCFQLHLVSIITINHNIAAKHKMAKQDLKKLNSSVIWNSGNKMILAFANTWPQNDVR